MNYGLNNNLGSANNTNRTFNSAKVKQFFNKAGEYAKKGGKYAWKTGQVISGVRSITQGDTGGERIKNAVMAIMSGMK